MGFSYLKKKNWSDITREELFFCAELYILIKGNETDFVKWLATLDSMVKLRLNPDKNWEVAFEVCFYRDLLKSFGSTAKEKNLSNRRTFDLCLFSYDQIVVIEAKAQSLFERDQIDEFIKDKQDIPRAIKSTSKKKIKASIVALASSQYFENVQIYGAEKRVPKVFDGYFSWKDIYDSFCRRDVFFRADSIYKN
jgi:hypothetical protein